MLRLRGGRLLYVTDTDLKRAGIDLEYDRELWERQNWAKIQRRRELPDVPEPLWSYVTNPVADQGEESDELTPLQHATMLAQREVSFLPHEDLQRNQLVEVLGIPFDGKFDNETTVLMQIRLAIERADYRSLRRAIHNAAELPFWTPQLDRAFEVGHLVMAEIQRKEDYRFHRVDTTEHGRHWVTTEELYGLRVPIPPRLAETEPTFADTMMGPRGTLPARP